MNLRITDPDHPHYGEAAVLVPVEREPEVTVVRLEDGTRTTVVTGQFEWEWRDGSA